mgnify:FL=1
MALRRGAEAAGHRLARGAPSDLARRRFIDPPLGCLFYSRKTGFRFRSSVSCGEPPQRPDLNPRDSNAVFPRPSHLQTSLGHNHSQSVLSA